MPLSAGTKLGPYEILGPLGAGGMGEVYRALDTKLGRDVAIKILPQAFSNDPEKLSRFQREARILASVNHPNISSIYSLEDMDGQSFIVLELVSGSTLAELIEEGTLATKQALSICSQIAIAVEAAHEKGIIHRDLKPANVKITPEGAVKVLDFGLAKLISAESSAGELSMLGTISGNETALGAVVGTVAYMSPEQTRGKALDKQTDVWSFGCVLFETLSGQKPFQEETISDLIVAILMKEPDWRTLPDSIPDKVKDLIHRCLQKEMRARIHSMYEVHVELEEILKGELPNSVASFKNTAGKTRRIKQSRQPSRISIYSHPVLSQLTISGGIHEFPAWSPDGKRIAYCKKVGGFKKIFAMDIESATETQLTTGYFDDIQPAWSPSGDSLLFVRSNQPQGKMQPGDVFGMYSNGDILHLDLFTGKEQTFLDNAFNPSFSPDGKLVAVDASWAGPRRIWIVNSQGSNPQQVTTDVSETPNHVIPRWSPDGKKIVFQNMERTRFDIKTVDIRSKKIDWVTNDLYQDLNPVWSGDFIYFSSYRSGGLNLWRIAATGKGSPQQLTIGAGQDVQLAVSPDGKQLAFTILRQNADIWKLPVSSASGKTTGNPSSVVASTREDSRGAWSPDCNQIAFNSDRNGDMNIWTYSFAEDAYKQLTKGPGGDYQPVWSLDGNWITFFSSRSGSADIWIIDSNGAQLNQLTKNESLNINPFFSPDGKQIAYQSDQSGRMEIWIMQSDGRNPHQVTNVGVMGHFLRWSKTGDLVFFRCSFSPQYLMMIPAKGGEPRYIEGIAGGSHISFSPDQSMIMDVVGHKQLWVSFLKTKKSKLVFEFKEPEARIDYPVWSPDGKWILFDKFQPQGGDIWIMKNF